MDELSYYRRVMNAPRRRVLVVDDHPAICNALRRTLREWDVFTSPSARDARREVARTLFNAVVADLGLPDENGLQLVAEFAEKHLPTLVFTGRDDAHSALGAVLAGASGFLVKTSSLEEVALALRQVADGARCFPEEIMKVVHENAPTAMLLTAAERRVLLLLGEGLSTKEIALRLGKSPRTVDGCRRAIRSKLGVTDLVPFAVRLRLGA